jgi:hypothetical protein
VRHPCPRTGVTHVSGLNTHQRPDLPAVGLAQFGQLGHQRRAQHRAHARHRPQQPVEVLELVVGVDPLPDLLVQQVDLPVQRFKHAVDRRPGGVAGGGLGFTTATGSPASSSASTGGRSYPPVASTTIRATGAFFSASTIRAIPRPSLSTVSSGRPSDTARLGLGFGFLNLQDAEAALKDRSGLCSRRDPIQNLRCSTSFGSSWPPPRFNLRASMFEAA